MHKLSSKVNKYNINKKLKDLEYNSITSLLKDSEVEREQVVDDLHETLGSKLVAMKFQMCSMDALQEKDIKIYNQVNMILDDAITDVRRLAYSMSDHIHKSFDMISALQEIKYSIERDKTIQFGVYFHGLVQNVSSELNLQLYRVIQSLITNTLTYANATEINIQLFRREEEFIVMLEDNGIGFDPLNIKKSNSNVGFKELESKLDSFNGKMFIDSSPGHGTTVTIEIPLAA
ncbi:MAG: ATP-binding protein [Reichenbachiella sp.]